MKEVICREATEKDFKYYMHNDRAAALYIKVGFKDIFIEKRFVLLPK